MDWNLIAPSATSFLWTCYKKLIYFIALWIQFFSWWMQLVTLYKYDFESLAFPFQSLNYIYIKHVIEKKNNFECQYTFTFGKVTFTFCQPFNHWNETNQKHWKKGNTFGHNQYIDTCIGWTLLHYRISCSWQGISIC